MGPQCCGLSCVCVPQSLQSCLTLCSPLGCSPPGPSVHGILQARILEWVAMPSSRGSSQPRDRTHISCVSCVVIRFFSAEPGGKPTTYHISFYSLFSFLPELLLKSSLLASIILTFSNLFFLTSFLPNAL